MKPLKLEIEKPSSSLQDTQKWLMEGGTLSAVKAFLFLEKYNALEDLKDVQEMMNRAGYSVTLKQKLVSHLYRIERTELVPMVNKI